LTPLDQAGRRISLLGSIDEKPALLIVERASFANDPELVRQLIRTVSVTNLGNNDIYNWYMARTDSSQSAASENANQPHDLKINLIYPCTPKHITKYSRQQLRMVNETPEIYQKYVKPYIEKQRGEGRLDWIYNILEGRTEQEDVFFRDSHPTSGFLILPDLNWDRKTLQNLHVLALVNRRDIWSLRDLNYSHIPWLKSMRDEILKAVSELWHLEEDQIKLYVHYQPTYYHFHVHVVHVMFEAGGTQAVGKAFGLENLIGQLEGMGLGDGKGMGESRGMADVALSYHLGEGSELWREVFGPLKEGTLR
jgi:m7GpppX diphosphatase